MTDKQNFEKDINVPSKYFTYTDNTSSIYDGSIEKLQRQNALTNGWDNSKQVRLCSMYLAYKDALERIAYSDQCNRCDGCGYDNGCMDNRCSLYIARKVLEK